MLLSYSQILRWKTQNFQLPLELTSNNSDWAQRPPCEWFCHLLPLTGALWQRRFWLNSPTNQQTDLPPRFRPSGSSVHPPACIVPSDNFQSCALTYNCACLYVCLCACQPEHLCVKLTVCDSWGPRTGHWWQEEIRYSPSVFITHSPFSPLSHCFTAKNHIHRSIYNAQDSYPQLVFFLSQLKNVYTIKCGGTLLAGPKKDIGTDLLKTASHSWFISYLVVI